MISNLLVLGAFILEYVVWCMLFAFIVVVVFIEVMTSYKNNDVNFICSHAYGNHSTRRSSWILLDVEVFWKKIPSYFVPHLQQKDASCLFFIIFCLPHKFQLFSQSTKSILKWSLLLLPPLLDPLLHSLQQPLDVLLPILLKARYVISRNESSWDLQEVCFYLHITHILLRFTLHNSLSIKRMTLK